MKLHSRSLRIDPDRCQGHMDCLRVCPTEALRVWNGKAQLLPGRCIDCGLCMRACTTGAITPRFDSFTEFHRFRHTIALPSPALYSQFGRDVSPAHILAALQSAGFKEVVDMTAGIEAVLLELQRLLRDRTGRRPLISPFCPTVTRLIQVRYPDLVELIAPVEAPHEIVAAAVREDRSRSLGLRREQIGVVYITPCSAKMVGLKLQTRMQPSNLDGAVAVSDIYGHLRAVLAAKGEPPSANTNNSVSGPALGWVLLGGQGTSLELENSIAVGGLQNVIRTLEDVEKGKLRDVDYIECRACRDGCIDGCLMIENPYEARSKLMRLIRARSPEIDANRPVVRALLQRTDLAAKPVVPRPQEALDPDMAKAIEKMRQLEELHTRLPQMNCGACGAPTCRAFAEDVVQGRREDQNCVFLLQDQLRGTVTQLNDILGKLPRPPAAREDEP